jgi:aldehyde dehydrogenase (NAD+)
MAKSAKNNTLKLKFESSRNLAPAPESKSVAKISERYDLFINGKFEKPLSKKYFDTINPATEERLAAVAEANAADVNKAVEAARNAYDKTWKKMAPKERAKYIYRIARMVQERAREFAVIEHWMVASQFGRAVILMYLLLPIISFIMQDGLIN